PDFHGIIQFPGRLGQGTCGLEAPMYAIGTTLTLIVHHLSLLSSLSLFIASLMPIIFMKFSLQGLPRYLQAASRTADIAPALLHYPLNSLPLILLQLLAQGKGRSRK